MGLHTYLAWSSGFGGVFDWLEDLKQSSQLNQEAKSVTVSLPIPLPIPAFAQFTWGLSLQPTVVLDAVKSIEPAVKQFNVEAFIREISRGTVAEHALASIPIDVSQYQDLIEHGIRNADDIKRAIEFFKLVDPESAGKIVEAVKDIPVSFEVDKTRRLLGAAHLTYSRLVDRREAVTADKITLYVDAEGAKGSRLLVFLHEAAHAAQWRDLPQAYRAVRLPNFESHHSLSLLYRNILTHRYYDEAMAFVSELHFVSQFEKKTGEILDVPSNFHLEALKSAHANYGIRGVYHFISQNLSYAQYRLPSLYLALLKKTGAEDFPDFSEVLEEMGIREVDGELKVDSEKLKSFYEDTLKPLMQSKGITQASMTERAISDPALTTAVSNVFKLLNGSIRGTASYQKICNDDLPYFAAFIGELLGDPASDSRKKGFKVVPEEWLEPKDFEFRVQAPDSDIAFVDRFRIVAHSVDLISLIEMTKYGQRYSKQLHTYLQYADPESARFVLSRWMLHVDSVLDDSVAFHIKELIYLAQSLESRGYESEAKKYYSLVIGKLIGSSDGSVLDSKFTGIFRVVQKYSPEDAALSNVLQGILKELNAQNLLFLQKAIAQLDEAQELQFWNQVSQNLKKILKNTGGTNEDARLYGAILALPELSHLHEDVFTKLSSEDPNTQARAFLAAAIFADSTQLELAKRVRLIERLEGITCNNFELKIEELQNEFLKKLFKGLERGLDVNVEFNLGSRKLVIAALYLQLGSEYEVAARVLLNTAFQGAQFRTTWDLQKAQMYINALAFVGEISEGTVTKFSKFLSETDFVNKDATFQAVQLWFELAGHCLRLGNLKGARILYTAWKDSTTLLGLRLALETKKVFESRKAVQVVAWERNIDFLLDFIGALESDSPTERMKILIEKVEADIRLHRDEVPSSAILLAIRSLENPAQFASLSDQAPEIVERLIVVAIDLKINHLTQLAGNPFIDTTLFEAIHGSRLDDATKDALCVKLIEKSTPEKGLLAQDLKMFYLADEVFKTLEIVLSKDSPYPKAKALLYKKIAEQELPKTLSTLVLPELSRFYIWVFEKIADAGVLDPEKKVEWERLVDSEVLDRALALTVVEDTVPLAEWRRRFGVWSRQKNVVELNRNREALRETLYAEQLGLDFSTSWRWRSSFFEEFYLAWELAVANGEPELAQLLFEIWSPIRDRLQGKKLAYYHAQIFQNDAIDLKYKRGLVEQLANHGILNSYVAQQLREAQAEPEREHLLLRLLFTSNYSLQRAEFFSLLFAMNLSELRHFADRYFAFDANFSNKQAGLRDLQTLEDSRDRLILLLCISRNRDWPAHTILYRYVFEVAAQMYDPTIQSNSDIRENVSEIRSYMQMHFPFLREPKNFEDVYLNVGVVSSPSSPAEIQREFEALKAWLPNYHLISDRVELAAAEDGFPAFVRREEPLVRYLLGRLYLELETGERQDFLKRTADMSAFGERFRVLVEIAGLEKVGQFASFWPGLPAEMRQHLEGLQADVAQTSDHEVDALIKAELKTLGLTDAQVEAAVRSKQHLGSGTIGDTYEATINIDGVEKLVVIKVVPDSKKNKFVAAMHRARNVLYRLGLRGAAGDIPGARQAHALGQEMSRAFDGELDLRNEFTHGERMRARLPEGVMSPEYTKRGGVALVTERLLVMEKVSGVPLSEVEDLKIRRAAVDRLRAMLQTQVLEHGEYHSDLQPGNILVDVKDDGSFDLIILDYGQVGRLNNVQQGHVRALISALRSRNTNSVMDTLLQMSVNGNALDGNRRDALREALHEVVQAVQVGTEEVEVLQNLLTVLDQHRVEVQGDYLLLVKGLATMRATGALASQGPIEKNSNRAWDWLKQKVSAELRSHEDRVKASRGRILDGLEVKFAGRVSRAELEVLFDHMYDHSKVEYNVKYRGKTHRVGVVGLFEFMLLAESRGEEGQLEITDPETKILQREGKAFREEFQKAVAKELLREPLFSERPMGQAIKFVFADLISEWSVGRWDEASAAHALKLFGILATSGGAVRMALDARYARLERSWRSQSHAVYVERVNHPGYQLRKRIAYNNLPTFIALEVSGILERGFSWAGMLGTVETMGILKVAHPITHLVMKGLSKVSKVFRGSGLGGLVAITVDFVIFKQLQQAYTGLKYDYLVGQEVKRINVIVQDLENEANAAYQARDFGGMVDRMLLNRVYENPAFVALLQYSTSASKKERLDKALAYRAVRDTEITKDAALSYGDYEEILAELMSETAELRALRNRFKRKLKEVEDPIVRARLEYEWSRMTGSIRAEYILALKHGDPSKDLSQQKFKFEERMRKAEDPLTRTRLEAEWKRYVSNYESARKAGASDTAIEQEREFLLALYEMENRQKYDVAVREALNNYTERQTAELDGLEKVYKQGWALIPGKGWMTDSQLSRGKEVYLTGTYRDTKWVVDLSSLKQLALQQRIHPLLQPLPQSTDDAVFGQFLEELDSGEPDMDAAKTASGG